MFFARLLYKLIKLALYLAFVGAAIYYTPRILSKTLDTPYPLATITSGSMWPTLKENDLILMRGVNGNDVNIGEIIVFENQRGFTIHRLIRREHDGTLVTKGDANNVEDQPIHPEEVVGRVTHVGDKIVKVPQIGIIARHFGPKIQEEVQKL